MPIDYLESLERDINCGEQRFACQGVHNNEWHIGKSVEGLSKDALNSANVRHIATTIYRLINKNATVAGDGFLVVRKILPRGETGKPNFEWSMIDTLEAAEMMRDVSQGPTPLFGATVERTLEPAA